jgi:tetratricopeptide (TPR) repeat protein
MTDPLRTDRLPESGELPERERDARVEQLLVAGLDHYFAGQHELAISVWTRVLFLDRGHARAKAYIDRARGAIAEHLREGDELLHIGAAAFDRGDAGAARDLLESAVARGASSEEALALLERLNRLEHANVRPARALPVKSTVEAPKELPPPGAESSGSARVIWIATGVMTGLAVAGVVAWIALTRPDWLPVNTTAVSPPAVQLDDPLPVPASSEIRLSRARTLYEDGRLRDALAALDGIGQSDPLKSDADELRAVIQRTLLDAARVPASAPPPAANQDRGQPRPKPPTHPS